jgi:hypothetical protein
VVRVILHQEDVGQGAVILAGGSGDELGLDVVVDVLFNVQLEVGVILLVEGLRLLQGVDVEVGVPGPDGQGLVAVCSGGLSFALGDALSGGGLGRGGGCGAAGAAAAAGESPAFSAIAATNSVLFMI